MMTCRLALVAAASLLSCAAVAPAKAADLGSGCCADLEERVAELEATTARKGNRVVSLQVYGQVNKALLIFDDGVDSDAFIVDNDQSGSRIGFTGAAGIKPGWTAGFKIELDVQDAATNVVSQGDDEGGADQILIRQNYVYIESERLGRISIGHQSSGADGITEIVLGNSLTDSSDIFSSFNVRSAAGGNAFEIGQAVDNLDGPREDVIRYDTPSIYGFIVSASWGDDDYADVALRFKKEWNSIRIAAGVGYQWDSKDATNEKEILSGSLSIMHVPTGLYTALAGGNVSFEDRDVDDGEFYYAQLGLERKFMPYGSTTVYADYGHYEGLSNDDALLVGLEAERYGFGMVQKIDAAAMEVYANFRVYSFEDDGAELEDFSTVLIGSRIKF